MAQKTIQIKLPEALYERVRQTALAASRSLQEVLAQSIALSLPPLEDDLPADLRADLAALSLKSDQALRQLADSTLDEDAQQRLESLISAQKNRSLDEEEEAELAELMRRAETMMLRKAEVFRLLAHRGQPVLTEAAQST